MAKVVTSLKPLRPPVAAPAVNGAATTSRMPEVAPVKRRSGGGIWAVIVGIILIGIAAAVYHFYFQPQAQGQGAATTTKGGKQGRGASDKIRVVTATAVKGDMGVYLDHLLGSVVPLKTVTVKTRVDGQLMKVNYTEGQLVKEGDQLVQLDARPFQATLAQNQAQLEHDEALLDNAKIDLQRYDTLLKQDSVQAQVRDTQVALVKQDQGTVDLDKAQIQATQLNITYCDVTSPVTGRVGLRLVDEGNQVHASDANGLIVITQMQPITVVFPIAEDDIPNVLPKLNAGQQLVVEAYDRANQTKLAEGTLLTTDNQVDPATGTLKLKAIFPNTDNALFPNQFVNAKLTVDTKKDVIIIPVAAIQYGSQNKFVYVVDDEDPKNATVTMTTVTVGTIYNDKAEIVSGLDEGDVVVTDGVDKLSNGAKVIVAPSGGDDAKKQPGAPAAAGAGAGS